MISFLHRYVAGLQIVEPGYRRFRVAPQPGGGITRARTWHESPHGRIEVAWELGGPEERLEISVPPGTEAKLTLPPGTAGVVGPDAHRHTGLVSR